MIAHNIEDGPGYFDRGAYMRDYRKTDKAKATKKRTRKSITDAKYLGRRIVAIDGEGINIRRGRRTGAHDYVMLAISDCPPLLGSQGLKTRDIISYLFDNLSPENINVIYGGSYDFNCWLVDLIEDEVRNVYHSNYTSDAVMYNGYGLRWIKGKSFEISKDDRTVTINDVISFFQRPFIQACDEYLGEYEGREQLVREKARRGNFTVAELDSISDYNQLELRLLVRLVHELRDRLNRVGLRPRRWNSPGAIASALFLREKVKKHRNENLPEAVSRAARFAYAGGRFEMIKYGAVRSNVYEYDINSAYPRAMLELPSLVGGEWNYSDQWSGTLNPFALYRVRFTGEDSNIPAPVFVRGSKGTISYPLQAENWIWTPEMESLIAYCERIPGSTFEVLEVWEYTPGNAHKPFGFIEALYKKRQELKANGDGAHVGIKLALNSLYGKLAQQVGWQPATSKSPLRVPTYHQLEWAGYVTSWCRSRVLLAAIDKPNSVIAFETDALFTTEPLNVDIGTGLGQWEETVFSSLTYVQSGHYYGTSAGKPIIKCRGVDKGFINRKNVERQLALPESERYLDASLTRFYGAGIALARGLAKYWRKWLTEPKRMQLRPTGKRYHGACWCDDPTGPLELGRWHDTYCPVAGGVSNEYPVDWINPNPEMSELSEFRESENYYGD